MIPQFYSYDPLWRDQSDRIVELVGRVGLMEEQAAHVLELRRNNQIWAMNASQRYRVRSERSDHE